jgi:hypothetical protein
VALLFYFISFQFIFITRTKVLVGLPQGVGGLAILFHFILVYFYNTHKVLAAPPEGMVTLFFYFICFVLFSAYFI